MDDTIAELNERFAVPGNELEPDVLGELQSILRLHGISPQELFYKWESYSIKMGSEDTKLDLKTARDFKKDIQDVLERESRAKASVRGAEKRTVGATPRAGAGAGDVSGMLDGLIPNTPRPGFRKGSAIKRKAAFETPAAKASKSHLRSSPGEEKSPYPLGDVNGVATPSAAFAERTNAGQIVESLNNHLSAPESSIITPPEARVKLKANTEMKKFEYKTMAMKLSEASEVLDDRLEAFRTLIKDAHQLDESMLGNPALQSTSEIVVVGTIASDTAEGKLNAASVVLETCRKDGGGLRIPLRFDNISSFDLFPGKIVALRGINPSGAYFNVLEMLSIPLLPSAASPPTDLDTYNARLQLAPSEDDLDADPITQPLNIIIASGPYTPDTDLSYEPFHALLSRALETKADSLILLGPFLDIEHPLLASGNFDLPSDYRVEPDKATLVDAFKAFIAGPLNRFSQQLPSCSIILLPSVRDAVAKHTAWPQDRLNKKEVGLLMSKQISSVTNPVTLSMNEFVIGMSSQDVLNELRRDEVMKGVKGNLLDRLAKQIIEQRHFFPVFPPAPREGLPKLSDVETRQEGDEVVVEEGYYSLPTGASLDVGYLTLGEWLNVRPDVLVTPSVLPPFVKVVESVLSINPGTLSKRKGPGTYARMTVHPATVTDEDRQAGTMLGHKLFERARVDIVRI